MATRKMCICEHDCDCVERFQRAMEDAPRILRDTEGYQSEWQRNLARWEAARAADGDD